MRLVLSIAFCSLLACAAPIQIARVSCSGATELTEAHLYAWLKANLPSKLDGVDPLELRERLLAAIPYADVTVERRWPDVLSIQVSERKPYAMLLSDQGQVDYLDRHGRLASLRRDQSIALWDRPAIRGCAASTSYDVASDCAAAALGFINWIDHVKPEWLSELSELRVIGGQIVVYLGDGTPIRFGSGPLEPQLEALASAWTLAQKHHLPVRGIRIVDAERVVFQTINNKTSKTGA